MLSDFVFIIYLIFVMAIAGIIIGISIEENILRKAKSGIDWTAMIIGIILGAGTLYVSTSHGDDY